MVNSPNQPVLEVPGVDSANSLQVLWLFNCIGTPTSLLYWNRILPKYLQRIPNSCFLTARPPSKPIPGTEKIVQCAGSLRIPLGKRANSYERQFVIPSPGIIGRIRRESPDVLVVQELLAYAVYVTALRRWLPRTKIMALIEGDPYQGARRPNPIITAVRRFASQRCDLIMTNNEGGRKYLRDALRVNDDRIVVHPYLVSGVDSSANQASSQLPDELNQDDGRLKMLFVGQLIDRKGISHLVQSIALLPRRVQDQVCVWLVGNGEKRPEIERQIRNLGVGPCIRVLGPQPHESLGTFYRAADLFVMPTLDDYRALVGFEAIAHGCPMLHSIHDGACHEVVEAEMNGFPFDPTKHQETADRIAWFARHRHRLPEMSQQSLRISRRYTVDSAVEGLVEGILRCARTKHP